MIKWAKIHNYHNMRRNVEGDLPKTFRSKIKLHGTNAAISIKNGIVKAQSREREITPDNDNYGFASWVEKTKDYWLEFERSGQELVVFGEWCGPGVQKKVAVSMVEERFFAIFASLVVETDIIYTDPFELGTFASPDVKNIHIIPWFKDGYNVEFSSISRTLERIDEEVRQVEACDPWVKSEFGIEGIGEGLVLYPEGVTKYEDFCKYVFKAKGEAHHGGPKEFIHKERVDTAKIERFALWAVSEWRCQQFAQGLEKRPQSIKPFIDLVFKDIVAECQAELEAEGLTEKDVCGRVSSLCSRWFLNYLKGETCPET